VTTQKDGSSDKPVKKKRLRWILLILFGLLLLGLVWFGYTTHPEITGLRNIIHHKLVKALGGPRVRTGEPPGSISGTVRDDDGDPVAGSTVLVSSPLGHTYTAESDAQGRYQIRGVPPGRYVPVAGKRGYVDGPEQTCVAGLCFKHTVAVRPGAQAGDFNLTLSPAPLLSIELDDSLIVSPTVEVPVEAPLPSTAQRTSFSFERAGLLVNDCHLYEPLEGDGFFPTLLLVLPGPVANWEFIPVPFAAQGFSLLACYPLRGIDIDEDAADLLTALEYVRQGRVPSRADPERLGLIGASFTSLHSYRLLALTDLLDMTLVLGGMADGFTFRHDVEMGKAYAREPFDQVLIALGFPNSSPELYFRYSSIFHLAGMPPACLLHGTDDELVPFSQGVQLAAELERRGMPHQFYAYEGLTHYFATTADSATTQQMFQDALACLRDYLSGE
jgi:dienelactone hydrolase